MKTIEELKQIANQIRIEALKMIFQAQSGHAGGSLSESDILAALYFSKLHIDPANPSEMSRDRFVLSKGHASPGLYACLALKGFFDINELASFRKLNSMLQGHPELNTPGIEFAGGSLGQGVCFANGLALAAKMNNHQYRVYCLIGDGECQEGSVWEAAMFASHHKLDNLIVILDKNQIQETGKTTEVMNIDPAAPKWKAFGFHTIEIDGHDMPQILDALDEATNVTDKPVIIVANTIKGKGVSFMELNHKFHGKAPNEEEFNKAIMELNKNI